MRIVDFGEKADGGKWTFRGGNLTWGNFIQKMVENGRSPMKSQNRERYYLIHNTAETSEKHIFLIDFKY